MANQVEPAGHPATNARAGGWDCPGAHALGDGRSGLLPRTIGALFKLFVTPGLKWATVKAPGPALNNKIKHLRIWRKHPWPSNPSLRNTCRWTNGFIISPRQQKKSS